LVTAKDGDEGLQIINSGVIKPDIVFSDINMPRINGIVFAQTLKEKIPDIPIVLMSTTNNPNHHLEIIKLGVPFYTKPTEFSGITDSIKDGISNVLLLTWFHQLKLTPAVYRFMRMSRSYVPCEAYLSIPVPSLKV
jgi:CheY-like chemotaxis protein